ncbi:hypothetical protein QZH41_007471 [Actinostola sp. cb2023]|nr:hypothetical protein QZH41_007471 [Actinostola sp. cb2023]
MIASVERYLAIEHPNFYTTHVTTKKLMIAATVIWISMPTAMVTTRLLISESGRARKIPVLVTVGANAVIILFCTVKVQVTAYRHRRAIAQQAAAVQQEEQQNRRLQEYKHTFTTETASVSMRGSMGAVNQLGIVSGILLSYVVGWALDWRWSAIVGAFPPALLVILMAFMPETARWYMTKKKEEKARKNT